MHSFTFVDFNQKWIFIAIVRHQWAQTEFCVSWINYVECKMSDVKKKQIDWTKTLPRNCVRFTNKVLLFLLKKKQHRKEKWCSAKATTEHLANESILETRSHSLVLRVYCVVCIHIFRFAFAVDEYFMQMPSTGQFSIWNFYRFCFFVCFASNKSKTT